MLIKKIAFLFLIILSVNVYGSNFQDSIGVENLSGKKIIIYKIEPKDNYYSIARKFNVTPKSIIDFNNNLILQIGSIIKIPTLINYSVQQTNTVKSKTDKDIVPYNHIVKTKETLYSISKLYNMDIEELKKLNGITENSITIGQSLKVFTHKDLISNMPNNEILKRDSSFIADSLKNMMPRSKYGITELEEKGTAVWINDQNINASKSYALHKTAPVGTVIKITNPMSERSVFAKVVGRYTENETTKDVIIVITKAAADAIGAIDKRFFVTIGYGIANEQ